MEKVPSMAKVFWKISDFFGIFWPVFRPNFLNLWRVILLDRLSELVKSLMEVKIESLIAYWIFGGWSYQITANLVQTNIDQHFKVDKFRMASLRDLGHIHE